MHSGWHSICLKTENMAQTRKFYEALGMQVTHDSEQWVQLTNGNMQLSLMTFLEQNWINFRGGDVYEIAEQLRAQGFTFDEAPSDYSKDEMGHDGQHWNVKDPEGNVVYFDTTVEEGEQSYCAQTLVQSIEDYMACAGLESDLFADFKRDLLSKYAADQDL